ncbi:MAG: DEAD/DEAH box helicase [Chloroflexi bacterium]|nr:DEAD/DEAH box helicase [Chloroflexota bacterium]
MNDFQILGLRTELLQAVSELGYQTPTAIQARAIPILLSGRDMMGQAQTGTGKTAAFALPILNGLDLDLVGVQALVLTPTRELADQVAHAIHEYGQHRQVRVLPVYGGQSYSRQISRLQRGVHVVVGTPGRLLDLLGQGVLNLSSLRFLVLDEADEMLNMGFIEDVEAILSQTPTARQTALFSATLPEPIRRLSDRYLREPELVVTSSTRLTVDQTEQRQYLVSESDKLAALLRLLEMEEGIRNILNFVRTKIGAGALAEALLERGVQADALHGDLTQPMRETVLRRFRDETLPVMVATDVAARGLDIDDISHVINYDVPLDSEAYVHRIGRTGRAGRTGVAITLVTPQERWRMDRIERFTKQAIARATLPGKADVLNRRKERFLSRLSDRFTPELVDDERRMVERLVEAGYDPADIAAAALRLAREGERQWAVDEISEIREPARREVTARRTGRRDSRADGRRRQRARSRCEAGMVRISINLGKEQGIRPGDVVGAIANEAGIPGKAIGAIDIQRQQTFFDVVDQHAERVLQGAGRWKLRGQPVMLKCVD